MMMVLMKSITEMKLNVLKPNTASEQISALSRSPVFHLTESLCHLCLPLFFTTYLHWIPPQYVLPLSITAPTNLSSSQIGEVVIGYLEDQKYQIFLAMYVMYRTMCGLQHPKNWTRPFNNMGRKCKNFYLYLILSHPLFLRFYSFI